MEDLLFGYKSPFFTGTVVDAVQKAMKEQLLLLVYVYAEGAGETEIMDAAWKDQLLVDKMEKVTVSSKHILFV